ncbi:MAG: ATP-binding protein [Litorivicinus sp.]
MYERNLASTIQTALDENPAVAILGPRQVGKTTLAFQLSQRQSSLYLDLEDPADYQKLSDPSGYLAMHADKLVILDEIQRYPDLFRSLRGVIDQRRREGRGNGRFLILGSASNELLQQSAESLAGRIQYCELTGLSPSELGADGHQAVDKLWSRGGFPSSVIAPDDGASHRWRMNFIRTYVERDIPQLGPRIPASTLLRFWTMLAHAQGELFNASKLAGSLGVQSITVARYLDLMVDLMLVRRLEPWHGNVKKRLVKSPRVYVRDSGLVHTLLNLGSLEALLGHPIVGKSWEGFVVETLINALPDGARAYFYRTSAGAEIDMVVEYASGDRWAIEVKASRAPKLTKGFHIASADIGVTRKIVVYRGEDTFPMPDETLAMSLPQAIQAVQLGLL